MRSTSMSGHGQKFHGRHAATPGAAPEGDLYRRPLGLAPCCCRRAAGGNCARRLRSASPTFVTTSSSISLPRRNSPGSAARAAVKEFQEGVGAQLRSAHRSATGNHHRRGAGRRRHHDRTRAGTDSRNRSGIRRRVRAPLHFSRRAPRRQSASSLRERSTDVRCWPPDRLQPVRVTEVSVLLAEPGRGLPHHRCH